MTSNAPNRYFFLTGVASIALLTGSCSSSIFEANTSKTSDITRTMRSPKALISMGDTTWRGGDVASAARFYQAAVKAAPRDPVPAFRLGRALQSMGAHKAAADHFRRVLELNPGDGEAKRQLANTLISMDDPKSSVELYREVIAESGDHRAFNGLGVAFDMMGKHKEALAAYRAGLAKQPENLSLKNNLALSLAIAGKYDNAATVLRSVAESPKATARHRQNLALVYGLAGKETAAARVAQVDLDGPSVKRNLDYYNWLRQQPRWMVQKMLRNGAPIKPQAASTKPAASAKPRSQAETLGEAPAKKVVRKAVRKPVRATRRETVRPQQPKRETPKRHTISASREVVDQNGVIRRASLDGTLLPPVRFARLEFGFRPVRDAEASKAKGGQDKRAAARVETRQPVVVQPRISTPMPVVVRGNGETPVVAKAATPAAKPAAKTAERPAVRVMAKVMARTVQTAEGPVEPTGAEAASKPSEKTVIRAQLALASAAREAEAMRNIEARFQRSGLEHLMGKDDTSIE